MTHPCHDSSNGDCSSGHKYPKRTFYIVLTNLCVCVCVVCTCAQTMRSWGCAVTSRPCSLICACTFAQTMKSWGNATTSRPWARHIPSRHASSNAANDASECVISTKQCAQMFACMSVCVRICRCRCVWVWVWVCMCVFAHVHA
jgi:hypothetical protein